MEEKSDLELLLIEDSLAGENVKENKEDLKKEKKVPPQKAEKNASIMDFIDMVGKIVTKGMRDDNVTFVFDDGKRISSDLNMDVEGPFITYQTLLREPKKELKPRERESVITESTADKKDSRQGRVYGQKFECEIQFNIIASEYRIADKVMNNFEDLIFSFSHYFKKNGVGEVIFKRQIKDKDYDIFRQNMSVRNLIYYVEIEKLYVMFDSDIEGVIV